MLEQRLTLAPTAAGDHSEPLRACGCDPIELADQLTDRLVPGDLLEAAGAPFTSALERLNDAVRVIGHLNRGLTSGAESALTDRVRGKSFELLRHAHPDDALLAVAGHLDIGLHDAHVEAAPAAAEGAHAGLPLSDARNQFLVGNKANELVLRHATTGKRGRSPANRGELDESTSIHQ